MSWGFDKFGEKIMGVFSATWCNFPAMVGFGVIDVLGAVIISAVPNIGGGGIVSMVEAGVVNGFAKTLDFATWDQFKMPCPK